MVYSNQNNTYEMMEPNEELRQKLLVEDELTEMENHIHLILMREEQKEIELNEKWEML